MKIIPFIAFLIITKFTWSQSTTNSEVMKDFDFDKETDETILSIKVQEDVFEIGFKINSQIARGKLVVTIYDPNGKKEGGFELESLEKKENIQADKIQKTKSHTYTYSGSGATSGNMLKTLQKPIPGTWKVKIESKDLTGKMRLVTSQIGK